MAKFETSLHLQEVSAELFEEVIGKDVPNIRGRSGFALLLEACPVGKLLRKESRRGGDYKEDHEDRGKYWQFPNDGANIRVLYQVLAMELKRAARDKVPCPGHVFEKEAFAVKEEEVEDDGRYQDRKLLHRNPEYRRIETVRDTVNN